MFTVRTSNTLNSIILMDTAHYITVTLESIGAVILFNHGQKHLFHLTLDAECCRPKCCGVQTMSCTFQ